MFSNGITTALQMNNDFMHFGPDSRKELIELKYRDIE